jgi:plasmid stability protein
MRRTLVQLDEATYRRLKHRAFRQDRSLSAVVRELLAQGLDDAGAGRRAKGARRVFRSVRAGRARPDAGSPVSEHHDEALARAFRR